MRYNQDFTITYNFPAKLANQDPQVTQVGGCRVALRARVRCANR